MHFAFPSTVVKWSHAMLLVLLWIDCAVLVEEVEEASFSTMQSLSFISYIYYLDLMNLLMNCATVNCITFLFIITLSLSLLKMGTTIKMLQLLMLQHSVATLRKNILNVCNVHNYLHVAIIRNVHKYFLYPQLSAIVRNVRNYPPDKIKIYLNKVISGVIFLFL